MIPAVFLNGVEPVAAGKLTLDNAGNAPSLLPRLEPGQILSARVGAKQPDGSFSVEVAGQEMHMTLPRYIASGDRLQLTFVSHQPRPTFALKEVLTQTANTPLLSAAGRLIATLMPQAGEPAVLARALATAPLLSGAPANGATLSSALEHTLAQSGLFYESHQAQWVNGTRDLAQLRNEPQARLALRAAQPPVLLAGSTPVDLRAGIDAADIARSTDIASSAGARRAQQPLQAEGSPMMKAESSPMMKAESSPMVQQQLAALESGRIVLQIEVWPKQWMEWEIEEREQQVAREPDAPDSVSSWSTRLRLDLPNLGELNALLALDGNGMHIKLDTASPASATLLQGHRASLHSALAAAGIPPAGIAIAQHGQS